MEDHEMEKFICIHGHFYQPPRENPWIEEVEVEDSAYPYHDWNARITAECYAPNAASRILNADKRIIGIVNNYAAISFNFGPTLLKWLEEKNPQVYSAILEADKESLRRFSGHGSAIAQAYNHIIMPLASRRDKRTQIIWGIQDFVHRFKRFPEGMWLPETAADSETLGMLSEQGILFTILSPSQASRVKKINEPHWTDVSRETLDCSMPYTCRLPGGKSIAIFFLDDAIGQELAFGSLLENGDAFAGRMVRSVSRFKAGSGILSVVSDGETYGHHHRFADMALAYALYIVDQTKPATLTIFGEYLSIHPPTHEVEIREDTSWSCPHGVERWRNDCGCTTRGTTLKDTESIPRNPTRPKETPAAGPGVSHSEWKQTWRRPLRVAMDWLRDELAPLYEKGMSGYVSDPWKARDDYIKVILDRSPYIREQFFTNHATRILSDEEKSQVLRLLEMQRHAMLMYTSCGWFFDDISGIESVQVMQYACRAMQLARKVSGLDLEPVFISYLLEAKSNIPEHGDGAAIYRNYVARSMIDLNRIVFNYAVSALIMDNPDTQAIRHFTKLAESVEKSGSGKLRMVTGTLDLRSDITGEEKILEFAVLHLGTYEFLGGIREFTGDVSFSRMEDSLKAAFRTANIPLLVRSLETEFGTSTYSLWHLFRDGQRETLFRLLESTLEDLDSSFRQIYRDQITLIHAMREMRIPVPRVFEDPVWYILNRDLNQALSEGGDPQKIQHLVNEMIHGQFSPDRSTLNFTASKRITSLTKKLTCVTDEIIAMQEIIDLFKILAPLSLDYELWECQNDYFYCGKKQLTFMKQRAGMEDSRAVRWISHFNELGTWLGVTFSE